MTPPLSLPPLLAPGPVPGWGARFSPGTSTSGRSGSATLPVFALLDVEENKKRELFVCWGGKEKKKIYVKSCLPPSLPSSGLLPVPPSRSPGLPAPPSSLWIPGAFSSSVALMFRSHFGSSFFWMGRIRYSVLTTFQDFVASVRLMTNSPLRSGLEEERSPTQLPEAGPGAPAPVSPGPILPEDTSVRAVAPGNEMTAEWNLAFPVATEQEAEARQKQLHAQLPKRQGEASGGPSWQDRARARDSCEEEAAALSPEQSSSDGPRRSPGKPTVRREPRSPPKKKSRSRPNPRSIKDSKPKKRAPVKHKKSRDRKRKASRKKRRRSSSSSPLKERRRSDPPSSAGCQCEQALAWRRISDSAVSRLVSDPLRIFSDSPPPPLALGNSASPASRAPPAGTAPRGNSSKAIEDQWTLGYAATTLGADPRRLSELAQGFKNLSRPAEPSFRLRSFEWARIAATIWMYEANKEVPAAAQPPPAEVHNFSTPTSNHWPWKNQPWNSSSSRW